jgi:hypothetical protein
MVFGSSVILRRGGKNLCLDTSDEKEKAREKEEDEQEIY